MARVRGAGRGCRLMCRLVHNRHVLKAQSRSIEIQQLARLAEFARNGRSDQYKSIINFTILLHATATPPTER